MKFLKSFLMSKHRKYSHINVYQSKQNIIKSTKCDYKFKKLMSIWKNKSIDINYLYYIYILKIILLT